MRTIRNLLSMDGRVYVFLRSRNICRLFQEQAESEGFTFRDGVAPTNREFTDIFALNHDWTINYVGWAGHMAFRFPDAVQGEPLIRVDYGKYMSGCADFVI